MLDEVDVTIFFLLDTVDKILFADEFCQLAGVIHGTVFAVLVQAIHSNIHYSHESISFSGFSLQTLVHIIGCFQKMSIYKYVGAKRCSDSVTDKCGGLTEN
jgi:hypothetical protein